MDSIPELRVDGRHLAEILQYIAKLKGLGRRPAVFSFADGRLRVELPDVSLSANASGFWPMPLLVSLTDLRRIGRELCLGDGEVTVKVADGKLRILGFSAEFTVL